MPDADKYLTDDRSFEKLFPDSIQQSARRHWTAMGVINLAVNFLAKNGSKVLDIGSGVGKFCLAGAYYAPGTHFYGVEQRHDLVDHAIRAQERLSIKNVSFIKGNFTQLNLRDFDHFYFFNSFFENLDHADRIDNSIEYSPALFEYYSRYLRAELQKMPLGTKIVTYHSILEEIPREYELVKSLEGSDLNFWLKR